MKNPEHPKIPPTRFITMSMADKYTAVCYIYDGVHYQDMCKEENPDGTFNYSEKCLNELPFNLPYISFDPDKPYNDSEHGLAPYRRPDQQDFPNLLSAINHYKYPVILLCLASALLFHLAFILFRKRSNRLLGGLKYYINGHFDNESNSSHSSYSSSGGSRYSAGPTIDEEGNIRVGKLTFNRTKIIGTGSNGTCVYKGFFEDSQACAVKRIVGQYLKIADREIDFLRSLQHPNLVRYLATELDPQFIYIGLERAEYTLADIVENKKIAEIDLAREELCRQAALGLDYLHTLDIVHRDIKPQNILISAPVKVTNERRVMISDFGLSKQLGNLDSGNTSSAMRSYDGTQGWMAPEIIQAQIDHVGTLPPTKSADVFSLGCVFYYVISGGRHPFGSPSQRQTNILKNESVLDNFKFNEEGDIDIIEDKSVMACKLIKTMIRAETEERPPTKSILRYPLFWSKLEQLQFLQDVSDRVDKEDDRSEVVGKLERGRQKIFAFGWKECLSDELKADLGAFRSYNERKVRHLLRLIRNKRHHYSELNESLKSSLGDIPEGFMDYFSTRFPELLPHVYQAMQTCRNETIFRTYYGQENDFAFC